MEPDSILDNCLGFQWDKGNNLKSWFKHAVTQGEAEQIFFNEPLIYKDTKHSNNEHRYLALGKTDEAQFLIIAFTIRESRIRVISARKMNRKEREIYEKS